MNNKGQFFSQDVIVAVVIFVFSIMFFMIASQSVYSQATIVDARNNFDESAHVLLSLLVEHPGSPSGWEFRELFDVNSFGLAKTSNVLDEKKVEMLFYYLDNNYDFMKLQLGANNFDLNIVLTDSEGNLISSAGRETVNYSTKLIYERTVYYGGDTAILKGVVTVG
jgi:hypothetical protein